MPAGRVVTFPVPVAFVALRSPGTVPCPVFRQSIHRSTSMGRRRNKANPGPKIGQDGAALTDDRKKQLHGYVTEIERYNAQKAAIQADIGLVFNSAKEAGFDTKAMRAIIKTRKQSKAEREDFEAIVDVYMHALGDFATTALGSAAVERARASAAH